MIDRTLPAALRYADARLPAYLKRYPHADPATVESGLWEGAWRAVETYREEKGAWMMFLESMLRNYVTKSIRSLERRGQVRAVQHALLSLDAPLATKAEHCGDYDRFVDLLPDSGPDPYDRVLWQQALAALPALERWVIEERIGAGRSYTALMFALREKTGRCWRVPQVRALEAAALARLSI